MILESTDTRLQLQLPYDLREMAKSAHGYRWDPTDKLWYWPKTLVNFLLIRDAIPNLQLSPATSKWLRERTAVPHVNELETVDARLWPFQKVGVRFLQKVRRGLLLDEMGLGKAQPLDALVLTPQGWQTMGDITTGDIVTGSSGKPCQVTGVYPQGTKPVFQVEFTDGAVVECCDDHLWQVNTPKRKACGAAPFTLPLKDIRSRLYDTAGNHQYFVPMVAPVEYELQNLPLEPYLLGVLLGDGCLKGRVRLSTVDYEILDGVQAHLPMGSFLHYAGRCNYRIVSPHAGHPNPVLSAIRNLGLAGKGSSEKFVPEVYKRAGVQNRIALLQGLMDTDGYHVPNSRDKNASSSTIEFTSTSLQLTKDLREIVQSLGGTTTPIRTKESFCNGKRCLDCYRICLALPPEVVPFRIARKLKNYVPRSKYPPTRGIKSVVPIGEKPTQCIKVDAADHLYVTNEFVLTHNTAQAITAAKYEEFKRVLVLCPKSLQYNWEAEIRKWVGPDAPVTIPAGTTTKRAQQISEAAGQSWVVTNWETARFADLNLGWDCIIGDEAHRIRNRKTQLSEAVRKLESDALWLLTGTPIHNSQEDLWQPLNWLYPKEFSSFWSFYEAFVLYRDTMWGREVVGAKNTEVLWKLIAPFSLRRSKSDPELQLGLPEKLPPIIIRVRLESKQRSLYREIEKQTLVQLQSGERLLIMGALAMITRLKQAALCPWVFGEASEVPAAKLDAALDLLEDNSSEQFVVYSQYAEVVKIFKKMLEKAEIPCRHLIGEMGAQERQRQVEEFKAGQARVLIATIEVGGVGLTFTPANNVLFLDHVWNPAMIKQAEDRIHRISQTKTCRIYHLVAQDTIDESIQGVLTAKSDLAARVLTPLELLKQHYGVQ